MVALNLKGGGGDKISFNRIHFHSLTVNTSYIVNAISGLVRCVAKNTLPGRANIISNMNLGYSYLEYRSILYISACSNL